LRDRRGEHLGHLFDLGDADAPDGEGFGHLQADVAGADDEGGLGSVRAQCGVEGERFGHGVQQVHTVGGAEGVRAGQAGDGGHDRGGTGRDHECVVAEGFGRARGGGDGEFPPARVDPARAGICAQGETGRVEVGAGAVSQATPVSDVTADAVGDAADAEVGVGVGDDERDIHGGIEFAGA